MDLGRRGERRRGQNWALAEPKVPDVYSNRSDQNYLATVALEKMVNDRTSQKNSKKTPVDGRWEPRRQWGEE